MTLGVWMVPLALLAAGVLLWASTWFESHVAPREYDPQLRAVEAVDTALVDTAADHPSLGVDGHLAGEPAQPAA